MCVHVCVFMSTSKVCRTKHCKEVLPAIASISPDGDFQCLYSMLGSVTPINGRVAWERAYACLLESNLTQNTPSQRRIPP